VVIQREGGEPLVAVECEVERRRLRRYYQENGVAVYPTVQRALNALARVVAYERKRG
jgi:acyl-CoA synthetase (NDP forming)